MKYLVIIAFVIGVLVYWQTAEAARVDFTNGQPTTMDDGEIGDTFEKTRYDFTSGQPSPVFDATATDESVVAAVQTPSVIINSGGQVINNGGVIIE